MYKAEQVLIAGADAGISMKHLTKMLQLLTKNGSSNVSQNSGKPIVSGLLSSELLLSRIKMYEQQLSEAKISDREYRTMLKALFGVKLIIGDLLIDNNR